MMGTLYMTVIRLQCIVNTQVTGWKGQGRSQYAIGSAADLISEPHQQSD